MERREGDKTRERRRDWAIKECEGDEDTQVVVYNGIYEEE